MLQLYEDYWKESHRVSVFIVGTYIIGKEMVACLEGCIATADLGLVRRPGCILITGYLPGFQARTSVHWPTPGHDLVRRFSVGFCPGVNIGWELHSEKVQGKERPNKEHKGKIPLNGFHTYWLVLIWDIKPGSVLNGSLVGVMALKPSMFDLDWDKTSHILLPFLKHAKFYSSFLGNNPGVTCCSILKSWEIVRALKLKKNVVPSSPRPLHFF